MLAPFSTSGRLDLDSYNLRNVAGSASFAEGVHPIIGLWIAGTNTPLQI